MKADPKGQLEDVLSHLPVSGTIEFRKGQMIYGPDQASTSIYVVVSGKVAISQISENGSDVLLEILRTEELFNEGAFLGDPRNCERAVALEDVRLMTWEATALEELMTKRPRLAVALLQIMAQRISDHAHRIESYSTENIERRLARSLIRFADRLGQPEAGGSVQMMPFTHEMLSRHVGTSRELVTQYMNRFRKLGYLNYSRRGIELNRDAMLSFLAAPGTAAGF